MWVIFDRHGVPICQAFPRISNAMVFQLLGRWLFLELGGLDPCHSSDWLPSNWEDPVTGNTITSNGHPCNFRKHQGGALGGGEGWLSKCCWSVWLHRVVQDLQLHLSGHHLTGDWPYIDGAGPLAVLDPALCPSSGGTLGAFFGCLRIGRNKKTIPIENVGNSEKNAHLRSRGPGGNFCKD